MFDFTGGNFGQLLVNCLAVLGGFLAGYLLAGLLANLLDRALFLKKSPHWLHRLVRILGGAALAILIAMIVFGHGQGWNLLGGGSDGTGDRNGETQPISTSAPPSVETPPKPEPKTPESDRIHITILGGSDVKAEKFYLIDDDAAAKTLAELKVLILKRKETGSKPPALAIHFSRNALPTDHPAVSSLTRWARETAGLDFSFFAR